MSELAKKRDRLLDYIGRYSRCAVAFSAGVDSTVVAMAAHKVLGVRAVAVTAASPSLAAGELDEARQLAARIGIRHEIISTSEFDNPQYVANQPDRCYHCKSELYTQLDGLQDQLVVFDTTKGKPDPKRLLVGVTSDEITGFAYTPDRRTAFVNVQHPGNGSPDGTNFPARFDGYTIPRDATLVITHKRGGVIGS